MKFEINLIELRVYIYANVCLLGGDHQLKLAGID
jgi:hypothetical protein